VAAATTTSRQHRNQPKNVLLQKFSVFHLFCLWHLAHTANNPQNQQNPKHKRPYKPLVVVVLREFTATTSKQKTIQNR
jgi:hypothetical protein